MQRQAELGLDAQHWSHSIIRLIIGIVHGCVGLKNRLMHPVNIHCPPKAMACPHNLGTLTIPFTQGGIAMNSYDDKYKIIDIQS